MTALLVVSGMPVLEHHLTPAAAPPTLPVAPMTWLFSVAGVLGLLSVVLPHDPITNDPAVVVISVTALAAAVVLHLVAGRVGPRRVLGILIFGCVMIAAVIVATGGVPNASATLFSWTVLYAFYALSWRSAFGLLALVGVLYAGVIVLIPPSFPAVAHWTTTIGTLAGSGVLVGTMKGRLDELVGRLANTARRDDLTGLLNLRGLREALDAEVARSARNGRSLTIVVVDADRFESVNDALGGPGGDEILGEIAGVLRRRARRMDVVARSGGGEFTLLLPETGPAEAMVSAERVRLAISREVSRPGVTLTASIGVATWPEHGGDAEALQVSARRALVAAKRQGRDRVVRFDPVATATLLAGGAHRESRQDALVLLAESLDLRDPSTAAHSQTVGRLAAATAVALDLEPDAVERVRLAGILHDVGKLSMPDAVLLKPGRLTPDEWNVIRRHPELGARLLEGAGLDDLAAWVRFHHERIDGGGYPSGLAGDAIPLEARILGVADAYEAMTADRPYRRAMAHEDAVAELRLHTGTQFDPAVVEAFLHAREAALDVH